MSKELSEAMIFNSINALKEFQNCIGISATNADISVKYQDYCPETRETAFIHIGRNQYPFISIVWEKYEDKFYMDYYANYCEIKFSEGSLIIKGIDKIGMDITITVYPIIEE